MATTKLKTRIETMISEVDAARSPTYFMQHGKRMIREVLSVVQALEARTAPRPSAKARRTK